MLALRSGVPEDAERLLDIHRRSVLVLGPAAYTAEECESWAAGLTPQRYLEAMTVGGEAYLVAEIDSRAAGFCSFKENEIVGLYVHPDFARRGVGTRLLQAAERALKVAGAKTFELTAALSALEFYLHHGYRVVERRRWTSRGGLESDVCFMRKAAGPTPPA